jgi:hypothetical protein
MTVAFTTTGSGAGAGAGAGAAGAGNISAILAPELAVPSLPQLAQNSAIREMVINLLIFKIIYICIRMFEVSALLHIPPQYLVRFTSFLLYIENFIAFRT